MSNPTAHDLLSVACFADKFDAPDFTVGEWHDPVRREDGVVEVGWWSPSEAVHTWEKALYDHHVIDPDSDYLAEDNVALVNAAIKDPALVADLNLAALRRVLTFLARAERHTGGGWFESAFESGMAQAATRRLGEFASHVLT